MEFIVIVLGAAVFTIIIGIIITKKKQKDLNQQMRKPYQKLAAEFERVGWIAWGYGAHRAEGQDARIQRAINSRSMELISYDKESRTAVVKGERGKMYTITPQGCSCPDFASRGFPCKHMYFAVMEIPG